MKRKGYRRPTMTVVELRHRTRLLIGSGEANAKAQRNSYGEATTDTWE